MIDPATGSEVARHLITASRHIEHPSGPHQYTAACCATAAARLTSRRACVSIAAWLARYVAGRAGAAWQGATISNAGAEDCQRLATMNLAECRRAAIHAASVGDVPAETEALMLRCIGLAERCTPQTPPPAHAADHLVKRVEDKFPFPYYELLLIQAQLISTLSTWDGWRALDELELALMDPGQPPISSIGEDKKQ